MYMKELNKRIVCKDGASVSIQANEYAYCLPRDNDGPYTHIEAGFPSINPPDSWKDYCDGDFDQPLGQVYGYMPIALVFEFAEIHGGIVSGDLPAIRYGVVDESLFSDDQS